MHETKKTPEPPPQDRPNIGGAEGGARNQDKVKSRDTEKLAPEAQGGAGAGRKWPGDS